MRSKLLGLLALGLLGGQANALTYSEPPDLGNSPGSSTALGDLAIGANTISGGISQTGCDGRRCDDQDFDFFSFNLLAGQEIVSIGANITNFASSGEARIDLLGASGAFLFAQTRINGNGTFPLTNFGTISTGPVNVFGRAFWTSDVDSAMNYSLVVNVRSTESVPPPVPLPAAAWLLLSGLAGVGFLGRRKKH